MGLRGGKHASLQFTALEPKTVVEIGKSIATERYAGLTVSQIFAVDAIVFLFPDLDLMMESAVAGSNEAVLGMEKKRPVQALRVVAMIAVILKVDDLSLQKEKWLVALSSTADLAWLLEALGDKAKLKNRSQQNKKWKRIYSKRRL